MRGTVVAQSRLPRPRVRVGRIYKRGSAFWIDYKEATGRRVRRSGGRTRAAATKALREAESGRAPRGDGTSFALLARDFLARSALYSKPKTQDLDRRTCKRLLACFGHRDPSGLSLAAIDSYVKRRRRDGVRDCTINGELSTLRAILNLGVQSGKLERLPLRISLLRTTKRRVPHVLSVDDAKKLLQGADDFSRTVLLIALATGLRIAEILHLTWADVDFDAGRILVTSKPGVWTTKTYAERAVYVPQAVLSHLKGLRERSRFDAPQDWIFSTRNRTPVSTHNALRTLRPVFKRAGLYRPGAGIVHRIRHTVATTLLANGVDLRTAQDILGHASIATTSLYLHVVDERKREAANKIGLV